MSRTDPLSGSTGIPFIPSDKKLYREKDLPPIIESGKKEAKKFIRDGGFSRALQSKEEKVERKS